MCSHLKSTEKGLRKKHPSNEYLNMIIIIDQTRCLTLKHTKMMTCFHFKIFLLGKKEKKSLHSLERNFLFLKNLNHKSVIVTIHTENKRVI